VRVPDAVQHERMQWVQKLILRPDQQKAAVEQR
jgi:hypothetical protein